MPNTEGHREIDAEGYITLGSGSHQRSWRPRWSIGPAGELNLPVMPYNGGDAPMDKERFVNARAKDYWMLQSGLSKAKSTSTLTTTSSLRSSAPSSGASILEGGSRSKSKDDMSKRGLPSPDCADAMAIAFAGSANAAPMNVDSHAGESITGDLMTKAW